jgi:hypothetical protein
MGACKQIDLRSSVGQRTLTSAEEQSYLVMYPRNASSTLAEPSTSMKPGRCLTHGMSCASMYEKTMRSRAWMFCNARSCVPSVREVLGHAAIRTHGAHGGPEGLQDSGDHRVDAGRGRCVSIFLDKSRRHIAKSQSKRPPKRTQRPPHRASRWSAPSCAARTRARVQVSSDEFVVPM